MPSYDLPTKLIIIQRTILGAFGLLNKLLLIRHFEYKTSLGFIVLFLKKFLLAMDMESDGDNIINQATFGLKYQQQNALFHFRY